MGNGGSLLLNEMGKEIDSHEAVIRFNGGITKGFESWVGIATFDAFLAHRSRSVMHRQRKSEDAAPHLVKKAHDCDEHRPDCYVVLFFMLYAH